MGPLDQEVVKVQEAMEKGEPFYQKGMPLEPTPDETPEDTYWRSLLLLAKDAAPKVMANLVNAHTIMDDATRASLLMQLWEKLHDRVMGGPNTTNTVKISLPTVQETSEQWGSRQLAPVIKQLEEKK